MDPWTDLQHSGVNRHFFEYRLLDDMDRSLEAVLPLVRFVFSGFFVGDMGHCFVGMPEHRFLLILATCC